MKGTKPIIINSICLHSSTGYLIQEPEKFETTWTVKHVHKIQEPVKVRIFKHLWKCNLATELIMVIKFLTPKP